MTSLITRNRICLLSAVAGAALLSTPAMAVPLLNVNTSVGPNFAVPNVDISSTAPTASASSFFSSGISNGSASARARTDYTTRASTNIDGSGTGLATSELSETIINGTTDIRDYFFTFQINGGFAGIDTGNSGINSTDEATSGISATVNVDGNSVWDLAVEVQLFDTDFFLTDGNDNDSGTLDGFDVSSSSEFISVGWDTTVFSIGLGELIPGDSFELDYLLTASADAIFGNFCSFSEEEGDDGYGGYGGCYFTDAGVSDPSAISALGISSTIVPGAPTPPPPPPTGVSEPESLALLGIGLAGLGLARRRRIDL